MKLLFRIRHKVLVQNVRLIDHFCFSLDVDFFFNLLDLTSLPLFPLWISPTVSVTMRMINDKLTVMD